MESSLQSPVSLDLSSSFEFKIETDFSTKSCFYLETIGHVVGSIYFYIQGMFYLF